jgi:hypothetical protein
MGVLMLKCPTTAREFSTGVHLEEESFRKLPDTVTKASCPHCDRVHSWWTREARLSARTQRRPDRAGNADHHAADNALTADRPYRAARPAF